MKKIKTADCVLCYTLLKDASLKGMDNLSKFAVIKLTKAFKDIANDFESFKADAVERLKDENFDAMCDKAQKWQSEGDKCEYSNEEKVAINQYFADYKKSIAECVKEEAEKENDVEFNPLSEKQFEALINANENWNVEQIIMLDECVNVN